MKAPRSTKDRSGSNVGVRFRVSRRGEDSSFGELWFARDLSTRKQVEVLFLKPKLADSAEVFSTAHLAQGFAHRYAVTILEHHIEPEPLRISTWERHEVLVDLLEDRHLLSTSVAWLTQVAEALQAAHQEGLVHGGISPDNIWIVSRSTPPGEARLANFGLARLLDGRDPTTSTGVTVLGGAAWLSPEFARGLKLTAESDIYSLGAVLYHCATGTPPFTGPSMKVAAAHVTDTPDPPSLRAAGVPHWLDALALEMLDKDPGKRPTAAEVVERLRDGSALLVDQAARVDHVTANAAPDRLPVVTLTGAHATHLPQVEPVEVPFSAPEERPLLIGLLAVVALLLGVFVGIGLWMS